jgi:sugar lactone lactonase YvrE
VAVNKNGTVYVADSGNNAIREIAPDGTITTLAGGKGIGYRDGVGQEAMFDWPTGIAVDTTGNIYVCDSNNNKIRRITPLGVVSTIAGGSLTGSSNGPGWRARFNFPTGIALDRDGNIYVADSGNNMIRKITRGWEMEAGLRY